MRRTLEARRLARENATVDREPVRPAPAPNARRPVAPDGGDLHADRARRDARHDRADPGRDGHRQGAGRARDPRRERARRPPVRRRRLRGAARVALRVGAVRPRARRVHGRARRAPRPARDVGRRHLLPRRDRRAHRRRCRPSSCARSRSARSAAWAATSRSPSTCGSSPRRTATSHELVGHGRVPRRPLLSAQRRHDHGAAAARAGDGHSAARAALPREVRAARAGAR